MKERCESCKGAGMVVRTCPRCHGKVGKECRFCGDEGEIIEPCDVCKGSCEVNGEKKQ